MASGDAIPAVSLAGEPRRVLGVREDEAVDSDARRPLACKKHATSSLPPTS